MNEISNILNMNVVKNKRIIKQNLMIYFIRPAAKMRR